MELVPLSVFKKKMIEGELAGDSVVIKLQFDAVEDEVQRTGVKEGWRARCDVIVEG